MYVEDIQYFEFGHGIYFTGLSFQFSRWCLDVLFLEIDIKKTPKMTKIFGIILVLVMNV